MTISPSQNRLKPFYSVLVDSRDRAGDQVTYVQQHNLEAAPVPATGIMDSVSHGSLSRYFTDLNSGTRTYRMTTWLRKLYPKD